MESVRNYFLQLLLVVLFLFIPIYASAINFVQIITLEKNGSGIIKLIYSEKESLVKEKNYVVSNLPFSKDNSAEYFNSSNTNIRLFEVGKDPNDNSRTQITVSMNFKAITDINKMKALTEAKVNFTETDTGTVFVYVITPEFTKANSIDYLLTILTYNGEVKSSNGKIEGKNILWSRSKQNIDAKKVMDFIATVKSEPKTTSNSSNSSDGDKKSCGLFGLELPIILLGGLVISRKLRKSKK